MEPSWGGFIDTAAQLRGLCAQGLVRTSQPEALAAAVSLLVDHEKPPSPPGAFGGEDTGQLSAK